MNKLSGSLAAIKKRSTPAGSIIRGARTAAVVLVCLLGSRAGATDPAFQFSKPVQSPPIEQDELLSVPLDADVYEATQDGLHDLRIVDDSSDLVPTKLRRRVATRNTRVRRTWTVASPSARPLDEGRLEILIELKSNDPPASGLAIDTPLDNFEQRVRVESSREGREWEPAGEAVIFDYSRYMDVRQVEVPFPETDRRHFRITIDQVTSAQESELLELTRRLRGAEETERIQRFSVQRRPFRIDRLQFWSDVQQQQTSGNVKRSYPPADFHVEQDADARQTLVFLETRREPITNFILEVAQQNFSRRAIVQVKHVDDAWRAVGEATLTKLEFKDLRREQLAITFADTRHDRYRIVIDNRDSPPLDVTGVTAEGKDYELVFLAAPGEAYRLVYGHADAQPADFDTSAVDELLRSGFEPLAAELGLQQVHVNPQTAGGMKWHDLLNNRALLGGIIAVLVVLLALGLFQAVRRVEDATPSPGDDPDQ